MENDVLKNKIAPWQEKGRWYHGTYDAENDILIADKTDDFLLSDKFSIGSASSKKFLTPQIANIKILDIKSLWHSDFVPTSASDTSIYSRYYYTDGKVAVSFTRTGTAGTVEFWAFIVIED